MDAYYVKTGDFVSAKRQRKKWEELLEYESNTAELRSMSFTSLILSEEVEYRPVQKAAANWSEEAAIEKLAGPDKTEGSCASLALAYAGRKAGYDVLDFRGGDSQRCFSHYFHKIPTLKGVKTISEKESKYSIPVAENVLKKIKPGKDYIFKAGYHAAVIRKANDGTIKYLELQSNILKGWRTFNKSTLVDRFGCCKDRKVITEGRFKGQYQTFDAYAIELDSLNKAKEFPYLLGFINTPQGRQQKGKGGRRK